MIGKADGMQLLTEKDIQERIALDEKENNILFEDGEGQLASHIRAAWEKNARHKMKMSDRLIDCLRARKGEYSPSQAAELLAQGGSSPIYLKHTGTKCRAASAWIRDVMLPSGERAFAIRPTTMPHLPTQVELRVREAAKAEAIGLIQSGVLPQLDDVLVFFEQTRDKALKMMDEDAMKKAQRMEDKIGDLMDEGGWDVAFEEFIEDFVTYPTAFIKGPYVKKVRSLTWAQGFKPVVTDELKLGWKRVSPFDMFPAPFAKTLQEGDLIERLRFTKDQLFSLANVPGYDKANILAATSAYEVGGLREWLWQNFERTRLESDSMYFFTDDGGIDALHYWGWVRGSVLREWGKTGIEDEEFYHVEAILVGQYVIRAEIIDDPMNIRPYYDACWDSVPGSIWGIGLPEQMDDHQRMMNGAARAIANNMALASGPQVMVITDMLAEGENIRSMHPFKIWQGKLSPLVGSNSLKPIDFFQPASVINDLLKVMETFEAKTDDVTNVPRYSYGNERVGGAGATATGLSMLMNSAAKGIRRAIASIDGRIVRPSVHQTFVHVMLHDPDPSLKGDCEIIARGAASILVKEQNVTRMQTFLNLTSNPIDMQIMGLKGRAKLLREISKSMDLPVDDIIPSDQDLQIMEAQQAAAQQAQAQAAQQPAPGELEPQAAMTPGLGNESQIQQNQLEGQMSAG